MSTYLNTYFQFLFEKETFDDDIYQLFYHYLTVYIWQQLITKETTKQTKDNIKIPFKYNKIKCETKSYVFFNAKNHETANKEVNKKKSCFCCQVLKDLILQKDYKNINKLFNIHKENIINEITSQYTLAAFDIKSGFGILIYWYVFIRLFCNTTSQQPATSKQ